MDGWLAIGAADTVQVGNAVACSTAEETAPASAAESGRVTAALCLYFSGEAALRSGLGEKEDKLGSFTKKALHIQLDR